MKYKGQRWKFQCLAVRSVGSLTEFPFSREVEEWSPEGSKEPTCDSHCNNHSGNTPQTNPQICGRDFPGQTRLSAAGGTRVFLAQVLTCPWAPVPAGSFKHFVNSLNFCTVLASWKLFQLCHFDISPLLDLPGRGDTTCSSRAPSTVSAQSNPQAPAWAAAVFAKLAVFSLSFYPKQMFSWAFRGCSLHCLHLGKKSPSCKVGDHCGAGQRRWGLCLPLTAVLGMRLPRCLPALTKSQRGGTNCCHL